MFELPAYILFVLLQLDASNVEHSTFQGLQAPPGVALKTRDDVRIPWDYKTYSVARGPFFVEMADVLAAAEDDPEPPAKIRRKNRIPGALPPEITEIQRLEALLLPPSDKVQVLQATGQESLTATRGNTAIDASTNNSVPPDPELAVGPSHVIAVVNVDYRIFDASDGSALTSATNLTTLMNANSDCTGLFDPNAIYDEEAERFIIGADANGTDYCMAVSANSNAMGTWTIYSFEADIGGAFFDYPHAGVGRDAIYVGSNQFLNNSFLEPRVFAVDKADLYAAQSPTVVSWSLAGQGNAVTPQPVNLHGYNDGTWPTSGPHYVITDQFDSRDVNIWTIEDPFGTGTLTRQSQLRVEDFTGVAAGQTVDVPQSGGDDLDAGDFRVLDFEYRNGYAWTVQNVSCNPGSGTVNCVRWAQFDLAANSIVDAGVFAIDGSYTLHPDLAVNRCNDLLIGFAVSDASSFPASYVAGRESDHTAGELSFSQVHKASSVTYFAFDGEPLRWGDYTGATVGPDGTSLWYLGEWADNLSGAENWSTYFARYVFPDSDSDDVPDSCDICALGDDDVDDDNDTVPNACDACEGSDDSLDADLDNTPDGCDTCTDLDNDGAGDPGYAANTCATDNCPDDSNADQADADSDGTGDVCDTCTDTDNDGFGNSGYNANTCNTDNCPDDSNADQADADSDGTGDVCDTCTDTDNDDAGDPGYNANTCATDNCPDDSNADQADADSDGTGDVCDTCTDTDNDGAGDPGYNANTCATDNCPDDSNADQADADVDGTGDACDTCTDTDNDGLGDPGYPVNACSTDNCPSISNADQADTDSDGVGDVCDTCTDTDGDGAGDPDFGTNTCATDNCPDISNADQADADLDGVGDVCDICTGDDATGDVDGDNVCADQDCNDNDGSAQTVDNCGVCGGSNDCGIFIDGFESGDTSAWTE